MRLAEMRKQLGALLRVCGPSRKVVPAVLRKIIDLLIRDLRVYGRAEFFGLGTFIVGKRYCSFRASRKTQRILFPTVSPGQKPKTKLDLASCERRADAGEARRGRLTVRRSA